MTITPAPRRLEADKVLVLVLEHDRALGDDYLSGLLDWSTEERERMARFRHQGAKTSWCLSRRMLNDALCDLIGLEDAHRRLDYGEHGKPFIAGCGLRFNWSHSEGCVALALAAGREVGIDVEIAERQRGDYLGIAEGFFGASERAWIGPERGDESWSRFLSLFVQKEAWLKAAGWGLSHSLAEAEASLTLPPLRAPGRVLLEVGDRSRYYLAVDASIGGDGGAPEFVVERRSLSDEDIS